MIENLNFCKTFVNICPELASQIPETNKHLSQYTVVTSSMVQELKVTESDFKTVFSELK